MTQPNHPRSSCSILTLLAFVVFLQPVNRAQAEDFTSTVTSGSFAWDNSANWTSAGGPGIPGASDSASVTSTASTTLTLSGTTSVETFYATTDGVGGTKNLSLVSAGINNSIFNVGTLETENLQNHTVEFNNGNTGGTLGVSVSGNLNHNGYIIQIGGANGLTGGFSVSGTTTMLSTINVAFVRTPTSPTDITVQLGSLVQEGGQLNIGSATGAINNVEVNSLSATLSSRYIRLSAATGTLTIAGTEDASYAGGISEKADINDNANPATQALKVVKNGSSVQTFTRANNYVGGTEINAGTILLSGAGKVGLGDVAIVGDDAVLDISTISAASYTLNAETTPGGVGKQTLSGAGTVVATGKTLTILGTLAPGNSAGQLTMDGGTLDISNATSLDFELGTLSDSLLLINSANLTIGTLNFEDFQFTALSGFGAGEYILMSGWNSLSGSLGTTTGLISGLDSTLSIDGNSLLLTVVPEPGTALLLSLGMTFLVIFRRRA